MKQLCLLVAFSISCSCLLYGQASDILVMKERKRNIRSWMKGDFIHFQFVTNQWIEGKIERIANDSIFLNYFITRQVTNGFGLPTIDTGWLGPFKLHVSEIKGMPAKWQHSSVFTNGALLQFGSLGYIFLNLFNSIKNNEQVFSSQNLTGIGIASGVFLLGKVQQWKYRPYLRMRKKYSMQIISTSVNK